MTTAVPSSVGMGVARAAGEIRAFARNVPALVFNVALPIVLMLMFGTLFSGTVGDTGVPMHDVVVSGVVASAIMSAAFGGMAFGISMDFSDGTFTRLSATPFTLSSYFVAKIVFVLALAVAQVAAVLVVTVLVFGFVLPGDPARWLTFGWVFALGIVATALLGVLVGSLASDGRSAGGVIQFPFIVLQFISGVYFVFTGLPNWLQYVGAVFPLKWMAQGMRSALLPDALAVAEPAGSWERGTVAIVLSCWAVGGFVLGSAVLRAKIRRAFS
ncbi:transport permease protein [Longimycelium tulufanense]|uniref:Transport permease protein n=1 Tax=Longimycelium tulufanense TaxID=907463 RepID=A0A8J3FXC4_9PSEU|nr:ABC transporter permease [Longimycelium tulufanense]GGM61017.1 transport permease protein [Longimycelium tulufanense]